MTDVRDKFTIPEDSTYYRQQVIYYCLQTIKYIKAKPHRGVFQDVWTAMNETGPVSLSSSVLHWPVKFSLCQPGVASPLIVEQLTITVVHKSVDLWHLMYPHWTEFGMSSGFCLPYGHKRLRVLIWLGKSLVNFQDRSHKLFNGIDIQLCGRQLWLTSLRGSCVIWP